MTSKKRPTTDSALAEKNVSDAEPLSDLQTDDGSWVTSGEDILALQDIDPALNMKMHLVNNVGSISVVGASTGWRNPTPPPPLNCY
jgi:hypothetical protein